MASNTCKTIEEKYQNKTDREHILLRPGVYIGEINKLKQNLWIYDDKVKQIVKKEINFYPGLYKIFDEALVNARDHIERDPSEIDKKCDTIKIDIDIETGRITIENNGDGIDVVEHKEQKIMVPEMIFGEYRSGTNFNDNEERTRGGQNGLGIKLTNTYSTVFEIETYDFNRKLKYYQKFEDNNSKRDKPKITQLKNCKPYTKVSFIPDYERFKMKGLTKDMMMAFKKRAYDMAFTTCDSKTKVFFNGEEIKLNFNKYIDLHYPKENILKIIDDKNERWKIAVLYDPDEEFEHETISFVNGICTYEGGTHCDAVINQISKKITEELQKKKECKEIKFTSQEIKQNLVFFIDSVIVNPAFNSQVKEKLTSQPSKFGSKYEVTDAFIKKLKLTGVFESIIDKAKFKQERKVNKEVSMPRNQTINIPKYEPATFVGKKRLTKGLETSLILCEGDSAATSVAEGLQGKLKERLGLFPLKGKLINVMKCSKTSAVKNDEIQNIMKIMNLKLNVKYEDTTTLNYDKILIMTDQDVDGFHIKGLIMAFISYLFPSLYAIDGFVSVLTTPIVKAYLNKNKELDFYNLNDFEKWRETEGKTLKYNYKYFKGLGTSNKKDVAKWFEDFDNKVINYVRTNEEYEIDNINSEDGTIYVPKKKNKCDDILDMFFGNDKARPNDRKIFVTNYNGDYLDNENKNVSYYDFGTKELIQFSIEDCKRSIPNIFDGLKVSQRKVLHGCFQKPGLMQKNYEDKENELRVAQLASYISEKTAYHHGEASLIGTIIGMAQNYAGSNNINLLFPDGQFGSRRGKLDKGCGSDAASARYIYTKINKLTNYIFNQQDYNIYQYEYDDGVKTEPSFFYPVIPMILVNGTSGIGTGFSSNIPSFNVKDIVENIRKWLNKQEMIEMIPFYKHFKGSIIKDGDNSYLIKGKYEKDENKINIIELPVGTNFQIYRRDLMQTYEGLKQKKKEDKKDDDEKKEKKEKKNMFPKLEKAIKKEPLFTSFTGEKFNATIELVEEKLTEMIEQNSLEEDFKLVSKINVSNTMYLFDENNEIQKFKSPLHILEYFCKLRLEKYQERKIFLLKQYNYDMHILSEKIRFIDLVLNGKLYIYKNGKPLSKDKVMENIVEHEFKELPESYGSDVKSFNYIINIKFFDFTEEKINELRKKYDNMCKIYDDLEKMTPKKMWLNELDEFMKEYEIWLGIEEDNFNSNNQYETELKKVKKSKK